MAPQANKKSGSVKTPAKVLIDVAPMKLELVESKSGKLIVRGEFARCDVATENKRVYPGQLWEKQIKRLKNALGERKVLGELDHPSDGQTKLQRASHILTDLTIENGVVVGEAEIIDTEMGKTLKALLNAGCKIGVSSRGYGSTVENDKGEQVVQEDYNLRTFDFVAEPADTTAYPEIVSEGKLVEGKALFEGLEILDLEREKELEDKFTATIIAARKEESEKTRGSMRDELTAYVLDTIAKSKAEMQEQVRSELLSDPTVAAAKSAIDSIKTILLPLLLPEETKNVVEKRDAEIARLKKEMAEQDLRLKAVESDNLRLAETARSLGYKLHVERSFSSNSADLEAARKLIGDVAAYKSAADLKARVQAVTEELAAKRVLVENLAKAEDTKAIAVVQKQLNEMTSKFEKVTGALDKSMEATTLLQNEIDSLNDQLEEIEKDRDTKEVQLHTEKQLTNHPKAVKIRAVLEASNVKSKAAVDKIVEEVGRVPNRQPDEMDNVRARVRERIGGGYSPRPVDEEVSTQTPRREQADLGVSLNDFRVLAGIPPKNR